MKRPENLKGEIWKDILGYEGLYQVSNLGRVKHLPYIFHNCSGDHYIDEKILSPHKQNGGYYMLDLYKNKKRKNVLLHRIIATTFIPNPNNFPVVNHRNGNRIDNSLNNLEWCTQSHNIKHSWDCNSRKCWMSGKVGILNHNSKKVNQYDLNMNFIRTWDSISDIERELGFLNNAIVSNLKGRSKTSYNYKWKYHE